LKCMTASVKWPALAEAAATKKFKRRLCCWH